jgi:hypothetical protein
MPCIKGHIKPMLKAATTGPKNNHDHLVNGERIEVFLLFLKRFFKNLISFYLTNNEEAGCANQIARPAFAI